MILIYLLYFNECSSLLHDSTVTLLTTGRQMANRAMSSALQTMNLSMPLNGKKRRRRRGRGVIQTTRYTKMKIQSWSMLFLNYLTFVGGDKFEMAPPHPRQTSGLLAPMMNH